MQTLASFVLIPSTIKLMPRLLVVLLLALALLSCRSAKPPDQEIRNVLLEQAAAWNRGDVRTYMQGYADSSSTVFVGKEIRRGYRQVLDRYLEKYATPAQMGRLSFSDIEVHPIGPDDAWVLGHWALQRTSEGGGDVGGWYTLLFHRTASGWKIILDHTS